MARDRKSDRHNPERKSVTTWMHRTLRERLERDAKESGLPKWGVSNQIEYELLEARGLWKEEYRPRFPQRPTQHDPKVKR